MKIVQFTAENIKRLKLVSITPKGHMVEITGKNGQGKTSVLDAIWYALGGKENIPAVPIRRGAEKARVTLDMGEFIVERRFTEKDSTITVKTSDGSATYASPQKMLDALVGSLSFDPLEFSRAGAAEQFAILRQTVKPDVDFDKIAAENKADYEKRTNSNKAAKEQRAIAANIAVPEGLPAEPVDESALDKELRDGYEANSQVEIQKEKRRQDSERWNGYGGEIQALRLKADELRQQAIKVDQQAATLEKEVATQLERIAALPPLAEKIDVDALRKRCDEAKAVNVAIQRRTNKANATAAAEDHEVGSAALTKRMADREASKLAALKASRCRSMALASVTAS